MFATLPPTALNRRSKDMCARRPISLAYRVPQPEDLVPLAEARFTVTTDSLLDKMFIGADAGEEATIADLKIA